MNRLRFGSIGSAAWAAEERASANQITQSEVEEFAFSARNDVDWLNEHMAEIFSENQINVAEVFKTPGKLRGKTPQTARKANVGDVRVPLSSIFSSTPKGAPNPFATPNLKQTTQAPKLKIAEDKPAHGGPKRTALPKSVPASKYAVPATDSGYYGSSSHDLMEIDELAMDHNPKKAAEQQTRHVVVRQASPEMCDIPSPTQPTMDPTFHSAKEEQTMTTKMLSPILQQPVSSSPVRPPSPVRKPVPTPKSSPAKPSPQKSSPVKPAAVVSPQKIEVEQTNEAAVQATAAEAEEDVRSPSDSSSPIRPIIRKSSMNFASLPAREPLSKSIGPRMSRTSHLDQSRTSYYSRHTGGKSLGNVQLQSDDEHDEMDVDDDLTIQNTTEVEKNIASHNKTYTQRLQDRISMLGKAPTNGPRPSKSIAAAGSQNLATPFSRPAPQQQSQPFQPSQGFNTSPSPKKHQPVAAPGAFPDDEDDWIAAPAPEAKEPSIFSPRPVVTKSYSADVMENVIGKETVGESEFVLPKQRQPGPPSNSPKRAPAIPERTTSVHSHSKSASVPHLPNVGIDTGSPKKAISVSNPALATVSETEVVSTTPSKSPSRSFRDSPLKQVKNKLSSILKSSKGLLASSAALSAEGKSSLLSPSVTRLGTFANPSVDSLAPSFYQATEVIYPDLSQYPPPGSRSPSRPDSPARSTATRRTRASAEREKRELKQRDKETKEAQRVADQMSKLEKLREKEREKARIFSEEQEKVTLEKHAIAQKEQEQAARPPPTPTEPPKATRTSPRKAKPQAQLEAEGRAAVALPESKPIDVDVEMTDALSSMAPPAIPRPTSANQASRGVKRPTKPAREMPTKIKQAPTVIRVNTTSSQQSQYHPSNSILAATLQDTLGPQQHQLKSKASTASLHTKPSLQSLKSSVSSNGRPKALELAAKRKEQEERDAQRKREAKAEMERKRAALQEEERRQEEQRRLEAQRQKEREREQAAAAAEAKKNAQRQATIEKAKQTRAPPPVQRSQMNGQPDFGMSRGEAGPPRPQSRLNQPMQRPQEEQSRPVNVHLNNPVKAPAKRQLQPDGGGDSARAGQARNGPLYQTKEAKRIRMSEEFDEDELDMGSQQRQSNIRGPPVRPSGGFKKDLPAKSFFPNGYAQAPPSAARDLFKATVTAQHNGHVKAPHPLDMAQVSKGAIPFAPNPNPAGPSTQKTPARPAAAMSSKSAAKSATRASPRLQNGDAIELPEIQTDDEDSDDGDNGAIAPWADSPDLRKALMRQETIDPMAVFGPPGPLNMEEVFSKSKDRWHRFRARTSSANWSGSDRLTEDDIRKDLAARDRMRRDGGWSFELSKDVM